MSDNEQTDNKKKKIRFVDLFCGLGGTRLGLEKACDELGIEHECMLSSDKKPASQIAYKHNFGDDIEGDICKIDEKEISDFDVLLGGFPCFIGSTLIAMESGYFQPISKVQPGDKVLTHKGRYREVLATGAHKAYTMTLEDVDGRTITCTPNHPILSCNDAGMVACEDPREWNEWTPAGKMFGSEHRYWSVNGSVLDAEEEACVGIDGFIWRCVRDARGAGEHIVYNLEVDEDNSYTANGIAVHNCQAFSRAGKRRGFNDTRGTMFFEVERILAEKKPKYVMLENVPELMTHDKGNTFKVIKENLEALGYTVSAKVLDATDFGLPQKRKRTFVCAVLDADEPVDMDAVATIDKQLVMKDIMEGNVEAVPDEYIDNLLRTHEAKDLAGYIITDKRRGDKTLHSWDFGMHGTVSADERHVLETLLSEHRKRCYAEELDIKWRDGMPLNLKQISRATGFDEEKLRPILDELTSKGYLVKKHPYCDDSLEERTDLPVGWRIITARVHFPIHRILDPEGQCITLTATDAQHIGVVDGDTVRKLTVREGLRLFGFPEDYDLSCVNENKAFDLIGNSICVPIVAAVVKNMLESEEQKRDGNVRDENDVENEDSGSEAQGD